MTRWLPVGVLWTISRTVQVIPAGTVLRKTQAFLMVSRLITFDPGNSLKERKL